MGRTKRSVKRNTKRYTKRNTKRYTKRNTKRRNTKRNTKRSNINRYTKRRNKMGGSGFTVQDIPPVEAAKEPHLSPTGAVITEIAAIKKEFNAAFGSDELITDIYKLLKLNNSSDENILRQIRLIVKYMIGYNVFLSTSKLHQMYPRSRRWADDTKKLRECSESIVKFMDYSLDMIVWLADSLESDNRNLEDLQKINNYWYMEYLPAWWQAEEHEVRKVIENIKLKWKNFRGERKLRDGPPLLGVNLDIKKLTELREAS